MEDWLHNKYATLGGFDPTDLVPELIPFFRTDVRLLLVGVSSMQAIKEFGVLSVTSGTKPAFLLMRASNSRGSSTVISRTAWSYRSPHSGLCVAKIKPMGSATYTKFIPSPRYQEIVAWYKLTLNIPRPIKEQIP
jgi:hypothetical protein